MVIYFYGHWTLDMRVVGPVEYIYDNEWNDEKGLSFDLPAAGLALEWIRVWDTRVCFIDIRLLERYSLFASTLVVDEFDTWSCMVWVFLLLDFWIIYIDLEFLELRMRDSYTEKN